MGMALVFLTRVNTIAIGVEMTRAAVLLKRWREGKGLTQSAAAALLDISQACLSDYERSVKSPDVVRALGIASRTKHAVPVESWAKVDEPRRGSKKAA
jgi:transcriptional regulator with XRE-family HTH domain